MTLTAAEWLRGHALTGFPWNAFGYALAAPLPLAQSASLIGLWGLTFIAIVVFASPATLADDRAENPRPWLPLLLGIAVLVGLGGWGSLRLLRLPTQLVDKVHLRIMQPNLQQDVKFNYAARHEVMDRYIALSNRASGPDAPGMKDVTHLIWPESAFPFFLAREADALAQITQLLPPNAVLITGAVRVAEPVNPTAPAVYNSIYAIDHSGSIVALYDKVHLVPFGEYLPFEKILARLGFQELTKQRGGFLAGDRRRPIAIPGAPVALPLICYEIIFPGDVVARGQRPGWIVNVTNDGWFGNSTGPYQHLQQARIRAIEEGLPRGARRQYRHLRGHRSAGPDRQFIAARPRRRDRLAVAATSPGAALCPCRRCAGLCHGRGRALSRRAPPLPIRHRGIKDEAEAYRDP